MKMAMMKEIFVKLHIRPPLLIALPN